MTDTALAERSRPTSEQATPSPKPTVPDATGGPPSPAAPSRRSTSRFIPMSVLWGVIPLLLITGVGAPYYILPVAERVWHPAHLWLRPSGYVGQSAGFLAFGLFAFLWLYPIRKRIVALSFTGSTARWLDVHIVAGILVPLVGAVHASWQFNGLIGLGYLAMVIVAVSGVIGRYLYVRIPRARDGLALTREEIGSERRGLVGEMVETMGFSSEQIVALLKPTPPPSAGGILGSLTHMVADDWARRRAVRALVKEWRAAAVQDPPGPRELRRVTRLARREMAVAQQVRMLDATNAVFRYWHVAHQPFAVTAFVAVLIHIAVVIFLGSTWIG